VHPSRCAVRAMRQTISPRLATSRRFEDCCGIRRSHSKDAVLRCLSTLRLGQRQGESECAPRVDGIDDAIVPEARRGIKGLPLPLELLADRRLELLFLRLAELAPGALQGIAFDGGEDARR